MAEGERERRDRQPRADVPHRRAEENLAVDQDRGDERDAVEASRRWPAAASAFQDGDVTTASVIVMQKKSCASPA